MGIQSPKPVPAFVAALPFLFARPQDGDLGWKCRSALAAAAAGERADETRRNTRGRVAFALCELGYQLTRRGVDLGAELPIGRVDIARALDISLCRVKRTFALLSLSEIMQSDGQRLRIVDWNRLCGMAGYDPRRLELAQQDEDSEALLIDDHRVEEDEPFRKTAAGDQACFV